MSDPAVREATASEELSLQEEYEMQGEFDPFGLLSQLLRRVTYSNYL